MRHYLDLVQHVLDRGVAKDDRTGTGTLSVFGYQLRFVLTQQFPLLTTKQMPVRAILHELLWMLAGNTNVRSLNEQGVHIWDAWAGPDGDLGPIYGRQWRAWSTADGGQIDQLASVVDQIKRYPASRRLVVSAWNVGDLDKMALAPCHTIFQFYVAAGQLSCQVYQRSADLFIGLPCNIASYALLTLMVAQVCDLRPGELVHTLGDAHLYRTHLEQARLQLTRQPYPLPTMRLHPRVRSIFDFTYEDFTLQGYRAHPPLKARVAV